ncbi:MAG: NAD(+) synthase [Candidatus Thalassarchaeaceae archaeon]|nr:NAD(+) synthase [Candidatus Thalassarchaeaceae archaeon]
MQDLIDLSDEITDWIRDYAQNAGISTLVVGVSGGIDSAVTSTLCARSGLRTIALNMPIHQAPDQYELSNRQIDWLKSRWENVESQQIDLTGTFDSLMKELDDGITTMAAANSRARLRMTTLYAIASSSNGIVVGTGNKVEDFGVGFFTKYGDGGVDISPIADLYKTEVYAIAEALGIIQEIRDAAPTDGLWDDGRTDEDQIGATYAEIEWAMDELENPSEEGITERQKEILDIYLKFHDANLHKMIPIPIFKKNSNNDYQTNDGN